MRGGATTENLRLARDAQAGIRPSSRNSSREHSGCHGSGTFLERLESSEALVAAIGDVDHIVSSFHLDRDDLDMAPFDGKGGMGQMYKLFGDRMDRVIEELNEALAA